MHLRRTADQREIPQLEDEHVGRGIDQPQRPIEIDRRAVEIRLETLARHELEDVSRRDELLALADHGFVFRLRRVAAGFGNFDLHEAVKRRHMQRPVEDFHQRTDPAARRGVGFGRRGELVEKRIRDDLQPAQAVVENEQRVRQHEHRVRDADHVRRRRAERRLELPHRIVGEVADHPAGELRQRPVRHRLIGRHFALERGQDVVLGGKRTDLRALADGDFLITRLEDQPRTAADDRPAAAFFGALRALQQKRMAAVPQLQIGG